MEAIMALVVIDIVPSLPSRLGIEATMTLIAREGGHTLVLKDRG
jgi:hypothetical protein